MNNFISIIKSPYPTNLDRLIKPYAIVYQKAISKKSSKGATHMEATENQLPLPDERIITFYSDRNLKRKMQFKRQG